MAKKKNTRIPVNRESDDLIFAVCERFFQRITSGKSDEEVIDKKDKGGRRKRSVGAAAVAKEISEEFNRPDLTRERIYPLLWEAINRKYLTMNVPPEVKLQHQLIKEFDLRNHLDICNGDVTVANTIVGDIAEHVNEAAADEIIKLIDRVQKVKKDEAVAKGEDPDNVRVHLGFGAGYAAEEVAKRLSTRAGARAPKLTLHALTSGGHYIEGQQKAPTTYFSYFDGKVRDTQFIGMFAPTVVPADEFDILKRNPSFRSVYERRGEIDILVTSLATSEDEHCLLRQYCDFLIKGGFVGSDVLTSLEEQGWVGDVMFQPYSNTKAITSCPLKSVALFDFDELFKFSKLPNKYVVVTCGPCRGCQKRKTKAIRPLLEKPELRMWTHLIIDRTTAEELLGDSAKSESDK